MLSPGFLVVRVRSSGRMPRKDAASVYQLAVGNWELTLRCTLCCMHCGSRAGRARANELSLDECLRVADELVVLGCRDLTLIGGEVFLYKGWQEVSRHLVSQGVSVNIVCNGYRLTSREIDQIERAQLTNVGVSIDGMSTNHNRIRGQKDAFDRLCQSLALLRQHRIRIGAVTSLMRFNCADLQRLYDFLVEQEVEVWQLQLVSAMGAMADQQRYMVGPRQVRRITDFVRDKNHERRMVVVAADSIGYFDDNEAYIRGRASPISCWSGCTAGLSSLFIDSVGNVKGCGALYSDAFIEGNVRERSLTEIWNRRDAFAYNRQFTTDLLDGKCRGCEVASRCKGGCRSSNYFATQSLYSSAFCCRKRRTG
jgi:radical SAM protein with 4Fe4S-binding SPASM domain